MLFQIIILMISALHLFDNMSEKRYGWAVADIVSIAMLINLIR